MLDEYQATRKYQDTRKATTLDDAVEYLRRAADALPGDCPARARALANLIPAVEARLALPRRDLLLPDLNDLRRELSTMPSAPVHKRLASARAWGYAVADAEGAASGLAGLETAVELLPQAAWWGHRRETREGVLADNIGLATDAAACAIAAGRPDRAMELLEGGRAVLWQQLLRTRNDRSALRRVKPRLARRMDRVAAALEQDRRGVPADERLALVRRWSRMERRANAKLQREWNSLAILAQKAVPEGVFTMPGWGPDLRPAGAEGPVVVVNVSRLRCHAVIVQEGEELPEVIELPELTYEDAHARAERYIAAMSSEGDERERERVVTATLDWLWRTIAAPVLDALDQRKHADADATGPAHPAGSTHPAESAEASSESGRSAEEIRARLWWCPTGPLMMLPLHAAARLPQQDSPGMALLDRVVPSYTPALLALNRARKNRDAAKTVNEGIGRRLLHVIVTEGPGRVGLPGAARTRAHIEERVPADARTTLEGAAATRTAVTAALARHAWALFDCHGMQDLDDPSQGGLVLHDGTLTVADLAGDRRDSAEFAFVAACATAVGGDRLPDESITLTSALQFAGYQEVVGILWTVPDSCAVRVTRSVYGELTAGGRLRPSESARALHRAVREERARRPDHPSAWVPFLHVGV
ncbi:CHAT domain-containing protein [Actinomadura sp. 9N215]|uniref:CHAT domain-containing protein n=1 Tax=Actinomadura sp. 9N215 TaxID=3375150 RepID=UPI003790167B